jgi:hypothetical protein
MRRSTSRRRPARCRPGASPRPVPLPGPQSLPRRAAPPAPPRRAACPASPHGLPHLAEPPPTPRAARCSPPARGGVRRAGAQEKVLQAVACFAAFAARLRDLAAAGPLHRARIVALGGAHVLVTVLAHGRADAVIEDCAVALALLAADPAARPRLLPPHADAAAALAAAVCRPQRAGALEGALLALEHLGAAGPAVAARLAGLGVLTAALVLCRDGPPGQPGVLRRAAAAAAMFARDPACLAEMQRRGQAWPAQPHHPPQVPRPSHQ